MPRQAELDAKLRAFRDESGVRSKGKLAVVLHVTRIAKERGLPLNERDLITEGRGQVAGLGRDAIQKILAEYGISNVLAEEGGRTSRGSLGLMQEYLRFLNQFLIPDVAVIEQWWIERVREHFQSKPFRLRFDAAKGLQAVVHDLLTQAKRRQQEQAGTMVQGAMLQHLIGAKLSLAVPELVIAHHGFSVADSVSDRSGDFVLDETILHATTFPSEALIRKCVRNLDGGLKPVILSIGNGVAIAQALAEQFGIADRVDILDAVQFIAGNLHELSAFRVLERRTTLEKLVDRYNQIVTRHETNPSLCIEMG